MEDERRSFVRFPMSYKRRLPCAHWKKFPVKLSHNGDLVSELCNDCVYEPPPAPVDQSKEITYNFIYHHPRAMLSKPK